MDLRVKQRHVHWCQFMEQEKREGASHTALKETTAQKPPRPLCFVCNRSWGSSSAECGTWTRERWCFNFQPNCIKWHSQWTHTLLESYRHFVRLFWNQVLTCASVIFRALAKVARSADARYFCRWKRFSSSQICTLLKEVRGFFLLGGVRFWYGWPIRRVTEKGERAAKRKRKREEIRVCLTFKWLISCRQFIQTIHVNIGSRCLDIKVQDWCLLNF